MNERLKNIIILVIGLVVISGLIYMLKMDGNEKRKDINPDAVKSVQIKNVVNNYNFHFEFENENEKLMLFGSRLNDKVMFLSNNHNNEFLINKDKYYVKTENQYEIINNIAVLELNTYEYFDKFFDLNKVLTLIKNAPVVIFEKDNITFSIQGKSILKDYLNINVDSDDAILLTVSFNDKVINRVQWDLKNIIKDNDLKIDYDVLTFSFYNYNLINEYDFKM